MGMWLKITYSIYCTTIVCIHIYIYIFIFIFIHTHVHMHFVDCRNKHVKTYHGDHPGYGSRWGLKLKESTWPVTNIDRFFFFCQGKLSSCFFPNLSKNGGSHLNWIAHTCLYPFVIIYASLNFKPSYSNRQADSSTVLGPLGKAWIAEAEMAETWDFIPKLG